MLLFTFFYLICVDPPSGGKFLHFAIIFYLSSCQPEDGLYGGRRDRTEKGDWCGLPRAEKGEAARRKKGEGKTESPERDSGRQKERKREQKEKEGR